MALGLALLLLAPSFLSCAAPAAAPKAPHPEGLALNWLALRQKADGSFPTDEYLPREIGTAVVLGLLSAVKADSGELEPVLDHSVKYFESRQSADGAFRYANCPDVFMNTSLTLLALFASRDRDLGSYRVEGGYVEVFDPRLLRRFFRKGAETPLSWDEFLEEERKAGFPFDVEDPEPEDWYQAARRAFAAKDAEAALRLKALVLGGQNSDGSWDADGPVEGRKIIGAAYRLRTLELLQAVLSTSHIRM